MKAAYVPTIACPHCGRPNGSRVTCCLCQGTRVIAMADITRTALEVWARPGCMCEACREAGPGPRVEVPAEAPFDTFRDAFAAAERTQGYGN